MPKLRNQKNTAAGALTTSESTVSVIPNSVSSGYGALATNYTFGYKPRFSGNPKEFKLWLIRLKTHLIRSGLWEQTIAAETPDPEKNYALYMEFT